MPPERSASPKLAETHPRLTGAILFLFALAVFYVAVVYPIRSAEPGSLIRISGFGLAISVFFGLLGAVFVTLGSRALRLLAAASSGSRTPLKVAGVIIGLSTFVIVIALKSYLRSHGYIE